MNTKVKNITFSIFCIVGFNWLTTQNIFSYNLYTILDSLCFFEYSQDEEGRLSITAKKILLPRHYKNNFPIVKKPLVHAAKNNSLHDTKEFVHNFNPMPINGINKWHLQEYQESTELINNMTEEELTEIVSCVASGNLQRVQKFLLEHFKKHDPSFDSKAQHKKPSETSTYKEIGELLNDNQPEPSEALYQKCTQLINNSADSEKDKKVSHEMLDFYRKNGNILTYYKFLQQDIKYQQNPYYPDSKKWIKKLTSEESSIPDVD